MALIVKESPPTFQPYQTKPIYKIYNELNE